jgi:hypothetical protein
MSSNSIEENRSYIEEIFTKLNESYQADHKGWGQFLDGNIDHIRSQFGRFGTSSGAIIMGLLERTDSIKANDVLNTLLNWVEHREGDNHYCQLLVEVMILAGVGSLNSDVTQVQSQVDALFAKRLANCFLWGDYWIDERKHDDMESIFVSSIILLVLSFIQRRHNLSVASENNISQSLTKLETSFLTNKSKHQKYKEIVYAALYSNSKFEPSRVSKNGLLSLAYRKIDLSEQYIYFYDYEKNEGSVGREYFVVPNEIFFYIAGKSLQAPSEVRLRAKDLEEKIKSELKNNSGLYKTTSESRASTLEQCFVAIAFIAFPVSEKFSLWGLCSSAKYHLKVERKFLTRYENYFVTLTYAGLIVVSYLSISKIFLLDTTSQFLLATCTFMTAIIKSPKEYIEQVLRRKK